MTDNELIAEMRDAEQELIQQAYDETLTVQDLRLTMKITARLIQKWAAELPVEE